ncbi:MAG: alkaline phosphatase family protein [Ardenticatenaceae bacterium]
MIRLIRLIGYSISRYSQLGYSQLPFSELRLRRSIYVLLCVICLMPGLAFYGATVQAQEPDEEAKQRALKLQNNEGQQTETTTPIKHFIVIMQENHTFDNYFGTYPGADGVPEGTCMPKYLTEAGELDPEKPECVEPFHIGDSPITDLDHSSATAMRQLNNGKMNGFVEALLQRNQDGALAMGYYDHRDLPYYWNLVGEFVLFDRFFSSAHGGSVWNHNYWVAGQPGSEKNSIPIGGYGDDVLTIFDRLEEKGVSWKFYVQNYDPRMTYRILEEQDTWSPQIIWVPLLNFPRFVDNPELFPKIVHMDEYYKDLENGTLPAVAYMVPSGASEHPPGSIRAGERFVKGLIQALQRSDFWDSSAFMVTYDDWGGWYDHVDPPVVDEYGYGFRVPTFLVSSYAKQGFIDNTTLDFTSVMKFIEENWGLEPVAERDANANSFMNAFDFSKPPRAPLFVASVRDPLDIQTTDPRRIIIYIAYGGALLLAGAIVAWASFRERVSDGRLLDFKKKGIGL